MHKIHEMYEKFFQYIIYHNDLKIGKVDYVEDNTIHETLQAANHVTMVVRNMHTHCK